MDEKRDRAIELLVKINTLEDSEHAFDEVIEFCEDVLEFYTARQNYKPEPLQKSETITLRLDDEDEQESDGE